MGIMSQNKNNTGAKAVAAAVVIGAGAAGAYYVAKPEEAKAAAQGALDTIQDAPRRVSEYARKSFQKAKDAVSNAIYGAGDASAEAAPDAAPETETADNDEL